VSLFQVAVGNCAWQHRYLARESRSRCEGERTWWQVYIRRAYDTAAVELREAK
jgi:hypothetical protein